MVYSLISASCSFFQANRGAFCDASTECSVHLGGRKRKLPFPRLFIHNSLYVQYSRMSFCPCCRLRRVLCHRFWALFSVLFSPFSESASTTTPTATTLVHSNKDFAKTPTSSAALRNKAASVLPAICTPDGNKKRSSPKTRVNMLTLKT